VNGAIESQEKYLHRQRNNNREINMTTVTITLTPAKFAKVYLDQHPATTAAYAAEIAGCSISTIRRIKKEIKLADERQADINLFVSNPFAWAGLE
jgi:hypothetical protein